jgi:hypothetical protein
MPEPAWFPASDPPPDNVLVLVWIAEGLDFQAGHDLAYRLKGGWYEALSFGVVEHEQAAYITHWQPLTRPRGA